MSEPLVFVYGTLLKGFSSPMRLLMARSSRLLGEGRVEGRLYDLGPYPALLPPRASGETVKGELYRLDSDEVLMELDRYEDALPDGKRGGMYHRTETRVETATGEYRTAWVYLYDWPLDRAVRIGSGDYRGHLASRGMEKKGVAE